MGQMMLVVECAYVASGFWGCGIGTWDLFGQLWFNFSFSRSHVFALTFYCDSCTIMAEDSQFKSFPCTHPNCLWIFKSTMGYTQHWNTTHCELTPASEPDPEKQFTTHLHSVLNVEL
jgi:hypothetical protein